MCIKMSGLLFEFLLQFRPDLKKSGGHALLPEQYVEPLTTHCDPLRLYEASCILFLR